MKTKWFVWSLTSVMAAVVMVQNKDVFFSKVNLGLDLAFSRIETVGLPVAIIVIGFFLAGYLVSQIIGFSEHHRLITTVDTLKAVVGDRCAPHQPKAEPVIQTSKDKKDEHTEKTAFMLDAANGSVRVS